MSLKKNIIYLHFKGKHLITSKSQYQYNYGQYLYFTDLNLPQAFEVHFSNKERGESETQIGSNKLVEIPDKFFWSGALEIYAWVYLHNETDDGETIYEVRIPLIKRARPTDKEPLPDQQSAIDKAIAELNNAVNITNENADKTNADKTQVATIKEEVVTLKEEIDSTANAVSQDAQSANTAAERSEQSAQNSAESERKALDYSDEAKGYAQSAFESKNTASQKAQVATNASAEAKDFRDEAETFKNEAEQIKQNVVDYRNETKGYRDEALTAKNDAQDSVNAAQKTSEQMIQAGAEIIENVRDVGSKYAAQAETAASNAQTSAESASVSATASAQSASQSAQIKADVEDLVDDAQGYAQASAQSATASANSASQASGYAQSASASAQSASDYASQADISANTASSKAAEASTSAQTASTKASESAQSASQALSYKTDAESAKTASQTAQGLAESARDSAISAKNDAESAKEDAESARDEAQTIVDGISGVLDDKAPVITDTASGSIASFPDGADDIPLKSLVVNIDSVQDTSSGDPSPENICPISGWTEVDVEQSGKNLFNPNTITEGSFIRAANTSDAFPLGGVNANAAWNCSDYIPVLPSTQYTQIVPYYNSAGAAGLVFFASKTVESAISGVPTLTQGNQKYNFTTPSNCHYIRVSYNNGNLPTDFPYPVVALGSDVSGFIASDIHSITINLGQTVYGGKLDVLSGVLTVDRAMVDLGTLTWSSGFQGFMSSSLVNQIKVIPRGETTSAVCDRYPVESVNGSPTTDYRLNIYTDNGNAYKNYVIVKDSTYSTVADFKTAMNGVMLCYELAEPIEIQLSANQLNSLYGVNNLWADSGDTEVEYRANTKLYIAKKIAEAISALS